MVSLALIGGVENPDQTPDLADACMACMEVACMEV
jgi:hypothetical protein